MCSQPCLWEGAQIKALDAEAWWASLAGSTPCILPYTVDVEKVTLLMTPKGEENWELTFDTFLDSILCASCLA